MTIKLLPGLALPPVKKGSQRPVVLPLLPTEGPWQMESEFIWSWKWRECDRQ